MTWGAFVCGALGAFVGGILLLSTIGKVVNAAHRMEFDAFMLGCTMQTSDRTACIAEAEKYIGRARP